MALFLSQSDADRERENREREMLERELTGWLKDVKSFRAEGDDLCADLVTATMNQIHDRLIELYGEKRMKSLARKYGRVTVRIAGKDWKF